jgi:UDP-glucose:(heptosyl)LPS alpha-1,3-glucosyltransferase
LFAYYRAMRIALITRRFDLAGGGTERDLAITAEILSQAGHEITIYTAEMRGPVPRWPVKMLVGPIVGRSLQFLWFARNAVSRVRLDGADVVLSFARVIGADILRSGGGAHSSFVRAARQWQSRAAATAMRLNPYHRIQMAVERAAFRHPNLKLAIAVSKLVSDDLILSFGLEPSRVVTLYNGVDCEKFRPSRGSSERAEIRRNLEMPADRSVVLFVGSGFGRKGLGFLIEAWKRLQGSPILLVAGSDRAVSAYQRMSERFDAADRVRFLGPRVDIELLMRAADGLALPSLFEPFGNVVVEAMASGLPVLASSRCGAAEIIPAEMRPLIVDDPADAGELAAKTQLLIDAPAKLGPVSRAAAESFTWQRYGEQLLSIIGSVSN